MMTMKFKEFLKGKYEDPDMPDDKFVLYVVKNEKENLYVGITNHNPWNRWFHGSRSHCVVNIYGELFGRSAIGNLIVDNQPISMFWDVTLYSCKDCVKYLYGVKNLDGYKIPTIHEIEPYMIKFMAPKMNITYNTQDRKGRNRELPPLLKKYSPKKSFVNEAKKTAIKKIEIKQFFQKEKPIKKPVYKKRVVTDRHKIEYEDYLKKNNLFKKYEQLTLFDETISKPKDKPMSFGWSVNVSHKDCA